LEETRNSIVIIHIAERLLLGSKRVNKKHKTVIVTPAGRKRYLEVLLKNLIKQKDDFSIWQLWINTENQEDIDYCKSLEKEHSWIKCYDLDIPYHGINSIHTFFKYTTESNVVYIRLDDDIVYLEKNFIRKLANERAKDPEPFLIYGNIVNNAICDHIHQRIGALPLSISEMSYDCLCPVAWANGQVAEQKHKNFFNHVENGTLNAYKFNQWNLRPHAAERCSINCISWLGSRFAEFGGKVGEDEEAWLSVDKPMMDKTSYNKIYGNALCVHYAFYTQREHVDSCPHILDKYIEIASL